MTAGSFILLAAVLGLFLGSFLNVVIHRLPQMLERQWRSQCAEWLEQPAPADAPYNLVVPRSACPHCDRPVRAYENVPVLSYLWLRGRCAGCREPISPRYPVVELLTAALSALVAWRFGATTAGYGALVFTWLMIALAGIDWETQLLPDMLTLPGLWLGLLLNVGGVYANLADAVVGAALGYGFLWSVYWLFRLLTGKEGMGYGDFKLLALAGAWLGWMHLPMVVLLSAVLGLLLALVLALLGRHRRGAPMPFGPHLAAAAWLVLLWGDSIQRHWMAFLAV